MANKNPPKRTAGGEAQASAFAEKLAAEAAEERAAASLAAAKAIKTETKAIEGNTEALKEEAKAAGLAAKSLEAVTERTALLDGATKNTAKSLSGSKTSLGGATETASKSMNILEKGIKVVNDVAELAQNAFKIMVVRQYDAIKAATLMNKQFGTVMPKNMAEAVTAITKLAANHEVMRKNAETLGTTWTKSYKEMQKDQYNMMKSFNWNLADMGAGAQDKMNDLLNRFNAMETLTGRSVEEIIADRKHAYETLNVSAEDAEDQMEALTRLPEELTKSLGTHSKKYRTMMKTELISTFEELRRQTDLEKVSMNALAASFVVATKSAAAFGLNVKDAASYNEKLAKGMLGKERGLNVQNFLPGKDIFDDYRKMFTGPGGPEKLQEELKKQMGDNESGIKMMTKIISRGNVADSAVVGELMSGTERGTAAKGKIAGQFKGVSDISYEHARVVAENVTGVKNMTTEELGAYDDAGGGQGASKKLLEEITKKLLEGRSKEGKNSEGRKLTPEEIAGQKAISDQSKFAEKANVTLENMLGKDVELLKIGTDSLSKLVEMAGYLFDIKGSSGGVAGALGGAGLVATAGVLGFASTKYLIEYFDSKEKAKTESARNTGNASTSAADGYDKATAKLTKANNAVGTTVEGQTKTKDVLASEAKDVETAKVDLGKAHEEGQKSLSGLIEQYAMVGMKGWKENMTGIEDPIRLDAMKHVKVMIDQLLKRDPWMGLEPDNIKKFAETGLSDLAGTAAIYAGGRTKPYKFGLRNVPYDNYAASLHEGEMVLRKDQAEKVRKPMYTSSSNYLGSPSAESSEATTLGKGNLSGRATVAAGDKLVFTIENAAESIVKLLEAAKTSRSAEGAM